MSFSKLVRYRNELASIVDLLDLTANFQEKTQLLAAIRDGYLQEDKIIPYNEFFKDYNDLSISAKNLVNKIRSSIDLINQRIDSVASELFDNDQYKEDFRENRVLHQELNSIVDDTIKHKISSHSDWHYPTLQINARFTKYVAMMVSGDPLYLTNYELQTLKDITSQYPEVYQRRLRLYETKDQDLSLLPQQQFGFVLCWDVFNYLSFNIVERYIRQVFDLLRPGGTFLFSYNNCDLEGPAYKAEVFSSGYCSFRLLKKLFDELGYEVFDRADVQTTDSFDTHVSWVEVRKPGILTTVKGHQSLAQIITK